MNNLACALTGAQGEQVALTDVSVSAVLHDLLSEVTVSQTYRNDEKVNIEAIYTFPLPLDAVLLELQVEIGGRVLKGVVVEKKAAEENYEDAIASGDAAVMLEMVEPGLCTMNVGNPRIPSSRHALYPRLSEFALFQPNWHYNRSNAGAPTFSAAAVNQRQTTTCG